ncbi:MAG TPA: MlaD family protein [Candidatus Binataceae bacterium]|nr:MlaD family protein [Candidatus Binataceae bacterium]
MARRANPKTIGLFVLGAIALAVAAVLILGSGRLFRQTSQYVLFFRGNVNGLRVGAAVKFKGVEIGSVQKILLNLRLATEAARRPVQADITIPVVIEIDQGKLARYGAGAFDLTDPRNLRQAIEAGLRAQLSMESLLTGLLYVDLEMYPDTQATMVLKPGGPIQEIPTIPTALEEAQSAAARVVAALDHVDFPKVFDTVIKTLDAIKEIVGSPATKEAVTNLNRTVVAMDKTAVSLHELADQMNKQVGPLAQGLHTNSENINATLKQMQVTLDALQASLGPEAPLIYQSGQTMEQVSEAARSLRELTDYLQRNPSALVRGRAIQRAEP